MLFITFIGVGSVFAADVDISVISNGNSVINVKAYHYIKSYAKDTGRNYNLNLTHNLNAVDWSASDYYIILNTGTDGSLDTELIEVIKSGTPQTVVLVTLIKNRSDLFVNFDDHSDYPMVDAVSAASLWRKPGLSGLFSSNQEIKDMHNQWIEYIFSKIDEAAGS